MVLELMMNSRCDFETFSIYPVQGLNGYCKASKYFKIDIITMSVKVYSIYNQKSYISFKQALSERNPLTRRVNQNNRRFYWWKKFAIH